MGVHTKEEKFVQWMLHVAHLVVMQNVRRRVITSCLFITAV